MQTKFDVSIGGSYFYFYTLAPLTKAAKAWIEENIGKDNGYQPYYPTIIVEPRYLEDILNGMREDGLIVD